MNNHIFNNGKTSFPMHYERLFTDERYASAFGYMEEEILNNFHYVLLEMFYLRFYQYKTKGDVVKAIERAFNGFQFSIGKPVSILDPMSTAISIKKRKVGDYFEILGNSYLILKHILGNLENIEEVELTRTFKRFTAGDMDLSLGIETNQDLRYLYQVGVLALKQCGSDDGTARRRSLVKIFQ